MAAHRDRHCPRPAARLGICADIRIILRLPSIYLAVHLHAVSYVIAAGLTVLFAVLVQGLTDRTLDRIDPATALKSVE